MAKEKIELLSVKDEVEEQTVKKDNFNYKIAIAIIIVLVIIFGSLVAKIVIDNNSSSSKSSTRRNENTNSKMKEKEVHTVLCSNPKSRFDGHEFDHKLEYVGNDFNKFTFSFYLYYYDEQDEDTLWKEVEYYAYYMPWKIDKRGYELVDESDLVKYRIFYTTTPEDYCKSLDGCTDVELKFDQVEEMLKDYQEQVNVTCTIS